MPVTTKSPLRSSRGIMLVPAQRRATSTSAALRARWPEPVPARLIWMQGTTGPGSMYHRISKWKREKDRYQYAVCGARALFWIEADGAANQCPMCRDLTTS